MGGWAAGGSEPLPGWGALPAARFPASYWAYGYFMTKHSMWSWGGRAVLLQAGPVARCCRGLCLPRAEHTSQATSQNHCHGRRCVRRCFGKPTVLLLPCGYRTSSGFLKPFFLLGQDVGEREEALQLGVFAGDRRSWNIWMIWGGDTPVSIKTSVPPSAYSGTSPAPVIGWPPEREVRHRFGSPEPPRWSGSQAHAR